MNLLSAIGNTPLVELTNLNGKSKVRIFGKLEGSNPGGSVKDRPAYYRKYWNCPGNDRSSQGIQSKTLHA